MRVGERAARHQRGDDRNLGEFGELAQHTRGARLQHSAADVQHRLLGGENHPRRFFDHLGVALHVRAITGQAVEHFVVARPVPLHRVLQHVFGQVDERRAGAAGGGDVERLTHHHRNVLRAHHQLVVLGDAARDADRVAFLERIGADRRRRNLAGDADHRNRVHICVAQRSHEVGRRGTAGDHRDARLAGDVRVTLGHVAGALFVAHENVADLRLDERVVRRENAAAGQSEHHFDVLVLERADERLGSGEFLFHFCLFLDSRCGF